MLSPRQAHPYLRTHLLGQPLAVPASNGRAAYLTYVSLLNQARARRRSARRLSD